MLIIDICPLFIIIEIYRTYVNNILPRGEDSFVKADEMETDMLTAELQPVWPA